jgi:subtilisin family serine protease
MKELFTILIIISSLFSFAQSQQEIKRYTKNYDLNKINELTKKIEQKELAKQQLINDFIALNKLIKRKKIKGGKTYILRDIIDGKPVYITTDNQEASKSSRTNTLHAKGELGLNPGIEGQNMTIGIWDEEVVLSSHQEYLAYDQLTVRATIGNNQTIDEDQDHATHVAGTMIAQGKDANAKGMAPQANLISYDWTNDEIEIINEFANGLLISNHSYGNPVFDNSGELSSSLWFMGCYYDSSRDWDEIAYNAEYSLSVHSAGNDGYYDYVGGLESEDGYDQLTGFKVSKNNLVVASVNATYNPGDGSITLSSEQSSSIGPTDDGRIKPDIAADGTQLYSSVSSADNDYDTFSGTSMASPNVAGSMLLLQQYYNELNSNYMKSATLKGLVCHTALEGNQYDGPDAKFGWGLIDIRKAAQTIKSSNDDIESKILENTLNNGESFTYNFTSSDGSPIIATICWTDPPGVSQAGVLNSSVPALVNDLDLRVIDNQAIPVTYYPWKLDLSDVSEAAITGDNLVDNVERINIDSPSIGIHTITVSHKGTLDSPQNYSLIFTGGDTSLSVDKIETLNFTVWPNPTSNKLQYQVASQNEAPLNIKLYDIQGRNIYNQIKQARTSVINGIINTENFAKGIYILKISQKENFYIKKVIIE